MPQDIMKQLLKICTTETPFTSPDGKIYLQCDGVSMGSSLGPLFANFYMSFIENNILPVLDNPPFIYTRYVDDIFLVIKNTSTLEEIKHKFEEFSVLKFTYELESKKSLNFLDVKVIRTNSGLETTVFIKSTNTGECINFSSVAPERYKVGVIKSFLHRAYNTCSNWDNLHVEIKRIKQVLTNNNFPMKIIEQEIKKFLDRKINNNNTTVNSNIENNNITLYYNNQMTSQYKHEEKQIKKIIFDNVRPINNSKITIHIYYKSKKLSNLFIKNNPRERVKAKLVYQYTCNSPECQPQQTYIGYTECTLIDRVRNHTQNGAIFNHHLEKHNSRISTSEILDNTKVLNYSNVKQDLLILEALHIKQKNPTLNGQREGETRILKVF